MGGVFYQSNYRQVMSAISKEARSRLQQACIYFQNEVKVTLSGPRSGKRYIIPGLKTIRARQATKLKGLVKTQLKKGKGSKYGSNGWQNTYTLMNSLKGKAKLTQKQLDKRKYTASGQGEAPAVRTGRLRNSIKWKLSGSGLNLHGEVGTALEYGPHLEFGTKKMTPRRFIKPTYDNEKQHIKDILGGKWLP